MTHAPTTVRRRTRLIATLAAVGLVTGLGALTAPTQAEEPADPARLTDPLTLARASGSTSISATANLKSTKRKKLRVILTAGKTGSLTVAVGDNKGEQHIWSFQVPKKTLKLNGKGKGKLVTKKIKPFGKIKLRITPTKKWKKTKCQGKVIHKRRPLKIKGQFVFDTKSAWGKVGGKKVAFKGGQVIKLTGNDGSACSGGDGGGGGGDGDACPTASATWAAYATTGGMSSQWAVGASKATIVASRSVNLSKPKRATRMDFRSASVPAPILNVSGSTVTLQIRGGGPVTGSTTLSKDDGFSLTRSCAGGKNYDETFWYDLDQSHGATPLTMKMSAYGSIRIPNTGTIVQTNTTAS